MHGGDQGKLSNSPKFGTSKEGNSHRDEKKHMFAGSCRDTGTQSRL